MNELEGIIKGQSVLFCLACSPFQALCMIEAIHTYKIANYRVLVCVNDNELPRLEQLSTLLNKFNVKYEIESLNFQITKLERIKAVFPKYNKYKVAFIGDCNNELLIFKAFRYISNGGTLVYLDDGIATIQFFNGLLQLSKKLRPYYNLICKFRRIDFDRYFYTVYEDLKDNRHIPIINRFEFLASEQRAKADIRGIYIIGTCVKDYCDYECIPVKDFLFTLSNLMHELRTNHPDQPIIYVPHGRETMVEDLKKMCRQEGVAYRPSEITVEMMLLEEKNYPYSVYGFTSSALYNIKRIFPKTETWNITFTGNIPKTNGKEITSQYYAKFGINRMIIDLELSLSDK